VNDGLGARPFDPAEIVADIDARSLPSEDIGLLTQPDDPVAWLRNVRARYGFVVDLNETEQRVARCNPGDRYEVSRLVEALHADE
jgi:hypothetical protein